MSKIINRLLCAGIGLLFISAAVFAQQSGGSEKVSPLRAETSDYLLSGGTLGVQFGSEMTVETRDAGENWDITGTTRFPGGMIISDTAIVDKKTLLLKKGISREFEKTIEYEIKDGKITGTETEGKKVKNFTLDAAGDVYNTRAFSFALYKRLPIAENYAARLKIFNPSSRKIEEIDFKVAGVERLVLEDGGVFDCYRIAVGATEDRKGKYTVWIDRQTRQIIKLQGYTAAAGTVKGAMELHKKVRL